MSEYQIAHSISPVTPITEAQAAQLSAYVRLLQKWNQAYNLTAIKDPAEMVQRHLVDSASAVEFLQGKHILDVGTGAGLPGLVLAVLCPDKQFTVLDSNNKKVRFLRQCQAELGLENMVPVQARVEAYAPLQKFDSVISRAFASLDDFIDKCAQHLATDGVLLAMKGHWPEPMRTTVPMTTHAITLPETTSARHMVVIQKRDL